MNSLSTYISERFITRIKTDEYKQDAEYKQAAEAICRYNDFNDHYTCNQNKIDDIVNELINIQDNIKLIGSDLVIKDKDIAIADLLDDGTLVFPSNFPPSLALKIRDDFANTDGSGDPSDYYVVIGDDVAAEWEWTEDDDL